MVPSARRFVARLIPASTTCSTRSTAARNSAASSSTDRPCWWRTTSASAGAARAVAAGVRGRLQVGPWYVLADELCRRASRSSAISCSVAPTRSGSVAGRTCSTRLTPSGIQPSGRPRGRIRHHVRRRLAGARRRAGPARRSLPWRALTAGRSCCCTSRRPGTNPAPACRRPALLGKEWTRLRQSLAPPPSRPIFAVPVARTTTPAGVHLGVCAT